MMLGVGGDSYYDAELFAWGRNAYGQLGQNNRTTYSSPRQITGTKWSAVGLSLIHISEPTRPY